MKKRQLNKPQSFKLVEEPAYLTRSEYMEQESMDYAKMRVGLKTVDDAIMNLGTFKKINNNFSNKEFILRAINNHDYNTLREISNYYFEVLCVTEISKFPYQLHYNELS